MDATKIIKIRIGRLAAAEALGTTIIIFMLLYNKPVLNVPLILVFPAVLLIVLFLTVCLVRECSKYKNAVLIKENQIMHFQVAKIDNQLFDSADVYVSCFGVLFGSKVIKFNIDGISLKNVVIGRDYLSFVYGSERRSQTFYILHGYINREELLDFMERVIHETGVAPEIKDEALFCTPD